MTIEEIRKAQRLVDRVETLRKHLELLEKSEAVDFVTINNNEGLHPYEILIRHNQEFLQTVKSLIKDFLRREEQKISEELNKL